MPICVPTTLARFSRRTGRVNTRSTVVHKLGFLTLWMFGVAAFAGGVSGFHGIVVNGVAQPGFALIVFDAAARPYMAYEDFLALGFSKAAPHVLVDGMEVAPLYGYEGMAVQIDGENLVVSLEAEPDWYAGTRMDLNASPAGVALPATPGATLTYTLQASRSGDDAVAIGSSQSLSLFGTAGLLQISTAITYVDAGVAAYGEPALQKFIRLGTTFLRDDAQHLTTLSIGDDVLAGAVGVPSVRYGGVTWQSNFGLNPAFSTLESPSIFDAARLPSTLEFFLNDRRVGIPIHVAPGPFAISGLPTVGASGTVNVLIRDAFNNERTILVPYLRTASLYRQGLHSFSYTAGLLRPDLEQYDTAFAATSHRWGLLRWLTLDAGATLSAQQRSMGVAATMALGANTVGDLSLVLSDSPPGPGQKISASVFWHNSASSVGANVSHASPAFEWLGDRPQMQMHARDDLRLFAGRALGREWGSVSVSFGSLSTWASAARSIQTLAWSKNFRGVNLALSAVQSTDQALLFIALTLPLAHHGSLSSSVQAQPSATAQRLDYTAAPLTGKGVTWRLGTSATGLAGETKGVGYGAAVDMRSDFGEHGMSIESRPYAQSWRAYTAGSLGVLGGRHFFGPPIVGGFALVSTGDAPHIPVYRWNLPVAISNAQGLALVTTLSPYQKNLLAVRPEDVPLEYQIANYELTAIPRGRGGVMVEFAMVRQWPALLVLVLPDGQPLPVGAIVHLLSTGESAPVGLRGEVYLQNVPEHAELEVSLQESNCRVTLTRPYTADPQPRLGPYRCALRAVP